MGKYSQVAPSEAKAILGNKNWLYSGSGSLPVLVRVHLQKKFHNNSAGLCSGFAEVQGNRGAEEVAGEARISQAEEGKKLFFGPAGAAGLARGEAGRVPLGEHEGRRGARRLIAH